MITIMSGEIDTIFRRARTQRFEAGRTLFHADDPVIRVYFVVEGVIVLRRHTAAGTPMTLQRAVAGTVLAEASAYAQRYHCDAIADTGAAVRSVSVTAFRRALSNDSRLAEAWAAQLARSVQQARLNAEIRSLKTVTERLDAWLGRTGSIPEKGQWQRLAAELGVTREALYRELAKRR